MRRTILAMATMLAALILGSGVALALAEAGPVDSVDSSTTASSCNPRVIDLGTLGGPNSTAYEINDNDWIVGGAQTRGGATHPVLWRSGNVRDLGTLNFQSGEAFNVNESGTIVGALYRGGDPVDENNEPTGVRGFVWREGEMKRLPTLGGTDSFARRVNEFGVVAGDATLPNGNSRAVIWRNGKVRNLGTLGGNYSYANGINERGQVVGASAKRRNGPPHAFLWEDGRMRDLGTLGGDFSLALGMNDLGQIVGRSDTTRKEPYHERGFVWSGGLMLGLPTLGGDSGKARGINNQGTIVGGSELPSGKGHATLYRCALGFAPNAYKAQQVSVNSSSVGSFGVESAAKSERIPSLDRLTPQLAPARR